MKKGSKPSAPRAGTAIIDLRAELVELDGVRQFSLIGALGYVPLELRVPGDAWWGE